MTASVGTDLGRGEARNASRQECLDLRHGCWNVELVAVLAGRDSGDLAIADREGRVDRLAIDLRGKPLDQLRERRRVQRGRRVPAVRSRREGHPAAQLPASDCQSLVANTSAIGAVTRSACAFGRGGLVRGDGRIDGGEPELGRQLGGRIQLAERDGESRQWPGPRSAVCPAPPAMTWN